jgi:hypothetical protein
MKRASKRVQVQPGDVALAPRVDDPRGFAVANQTGRALTVSFRYNSDAHIQTVVIEEPRPARRAAGEPEASAGDLPA